MRPFHLAFALMFFWTQVTQAEVISSYNLSNSTGAEFFVGKDYGKPLITINLINGVSRPGVYHVPVDTNLAQLFAYAGGTSDAADLGSVSIVRTNGRAIDRKLVDIDQLLKHPSSFPTMNDQDVVRIDMKTSLDSSLKWATLLASIASIGLSIALISEVRKQKP